MSSIDKGVENLVSGMGKNIRVTKQGNTIIGTINGERVFAIADRYGVLNNEERDSITRQIRQFEAAREQAEERRRQAEAMMREAQRRQEEARNEQLRREAAEMAARAAREKADAERAILEAQQAERRAIEERARIAREQEEERIRREEAIRVAREEAERRERERLEAERQAAHKELQDALNAKTEELSNIHSSYVLQENIAKQNLQKREERLRQLERKSDGMVDISAIKTRQDQEHKRQMEILEKEKALAESRLQEVRQVRALVGSHMTTEQYGELLGRSNGVAVPPASESSVEYTHHTLMEEYKLLEEKMDALAQARRALEKYASAEGTVGRLAQGALEKIQRASIQSHEDLDVLIQNCADKLVLIGEEESMAEIVAMGKRISQISGQARATKTSATATVDVAYKAKDYRKEIVRKARAVYEGYERLRQAAYSSCTAQQNQNVRNRLNEILLGTEHEEEVLQEVEWLEDQLHGIIQADKLHEEDYLEYQDIVRELKEYGVADEAIQPFDVNNWENQRADMLNQLAREHREYEKSQLLMTDTCVKQVMESMGYEVFSTIGDNGQFVRETLFTRPGYPGVMWQVISYSNGSIYRRIIGVNMGETQTDVEYVKAVAAEMDEANEPQEFVERWLEVSGNRVRLTSEVDHDSDNSDEAIERNGYHYLRGEKLDAYESRMAAYEADEASETEKDEKDEQDEQDRTERRTDKAKKTQKKRRATQVPVTHGKVMPNSSDKLRDEQVRSRRMSGYAHRTKR